MKISANNIENKGAVLWETYRNNCNGEEISENHLLTNFWANYQELILQAKMEVKPEFPVPVAVSKANTGESLESFFAKYWTGNVFFAEHTWEKKQSWLNKAEMVFLLILTLIAVPALFLGHVKVSIAMIGVVVITTFFKEVSMPDSRKNNYEKKIRIQFFSDKLIYEIRRNEEENPAKIVVDYHLIVALWQEEEELKIVKQQAKTLWFDTNYLRTYEVIIHKEMNEFENIRLFLNELVMHNFQKQLLV